MLVLALVVRVLPVYITKQRLDTYAKMELVREAECRQVGAEPRVRRPDIRWSPPDINSTMRVTLNLTLETDIGLFEGLIPITLTAEATGKSEEVRKAIFRRRSTARRPMILAIVLVAADAVHAISEFAVRIIAQGVKPL